MWTKYLTLKVVVRREIVPRDYSFIKGSLDTYFIYFTNIDHKVLIKSNEMPLETLATFYCIVHTEKKMAKGNNKIGYAL